MCGAMHALAAPAILVFFVTGILSKAKPCACLVTKLPPAITGLGASGMKSFTL